MLKGSTSTLFLVMLTLAGTALLAPRHLQSKPAAGDVIDPPGRDAVLDWNAVALQAVAVDHSHIYGDPEQGGPTRASRALAIIHVAMYDAANSVNPAHKPYHAWHPIRGASLDAAIATAAWHTLSDLYPLQSLETKRAWIPRLIRESSLVVFGHDPDFAVASLQEQAGKVVAEPVDLNS